MNGEPVVESSLQVVEYWVAKGLLQFIVVTWAVVD